MKKYIDYYENIYLVGKAKEIAITYKKMVKSTNTNLVPLFTDFPIVNKNKVYAICIESISKWFYIENSDDILFMMITGDLKEYKGLI